MNFAETKERVALQAELTAPRDHGKEAQNQGQTSLKTAVSPGMGF
ncbi:MAG: hypothetical protein U9P14_10960 [Gemmatimonadota bacterium]|nr:hypothetical protein [Gemmatimonadota bacterium]